MDNAGTVRYVITADNEQFIEQLAAAGKALSAFAENVSDVDKEVNSLGSRETVYSSNKFTSAIQESANQLGRFATALGNVGWHSFTTAAGLASTTLVKFASGAVSDTQFLENTQIQMQGLTHSIEDGNKAMAMATQYFKNNPFNRFDVTDATKQLIQYGAELDDIPSLLDKMGKVSLSTGVEINTLSRIYQSAMSNGRISTGDINLLAERGIPIWKALADVTGKTNADIRKDLETGKLAVEDFQKAFDLLVDDNAMEQFNNTFSRQLDRFKGRLSNMRAAIAGYTMDMEKGLQVDPNGLYRSVTEVLKVFANTFDYGVGKQFLESLTKLGNGLAWIINKIMGFYEITVKAADGTEKVVRMSSTLDKFFSALGKAIGFLSDNMELMLPIGIGALSMFGGLLSKVPVFGQILGPVTDGVKGLTSAFKNLSLPLKIIVAILGLGAFKALREGELSEPLQSIIKSIEKIGKALAPVVKRLMEVAETVGEKVIVTSINALAKILEVLANVLEKIPTEVLVKLTEAIIGMIAIKKVSEPLGGFLTKMHQVSGVISSIFHGGASGSGNSIIGQFKKVFGSKDEIESISGSIKEATGIASSAKDAASKVADSGKDSTKIRDALKNIALIAVDIALVGAAIGIADRAIVSDFPTLMTKLGAMAIAVVGMGAIAKAAEKVKISKDALKTLAIVAAEIGELGVALGIADRLIVSDFPTLVLKFAAMGIAIVGMGALAKIAGSIDIPKSGILTIALLAADIAAVGLALGVADRMIQSDFKTLAAKLGAMGIAIGEFAVLAGILGALVDTGIGAIILGSGIATILAFAGAIASIASAIGLVDKEVPSNIKPIIQKIKNINQCLQVMAEGKWGNPIKSFVKLVDTTVLATTTLIYVEAAKALSQIQKISLDKNTLERKVLLITECLQIVSNDRGNQSLIHIFKTTISQFFGAVDVKTLSQVVETYVNIAKSLNELQSIDLKSYNISQKVIFIAQTIDYLASTKEDSVGMAISNTVRNFLNQVDVHIIEELVSIYVSIARKLNEIQTVELKFKEIADKVDFIRQTIDYVTYQGDNSIFESLINSLKSGALQESVKSAEKILEIFSNLAGTLSKIKDINITNEDLTKISSNITLLQGIIGQVLGQNGGGGFVGFLRDALYGGSITDEEVKQAVKILEVFNQFKEPLEKLSNFKVPENLSSDIGKITQVLDEINKIKPVPSIEYKVKTVEGSKTMFTAMNDIAKAAGELKDVGDENGEIRSKIYHIRDLVAQIGMVWEAPEMENKNYVVHMTQSILYSMSEMATAAHELKDVDDKISEKVIRVRNLVAEVGQIWEAPEIENKNTVVQTSKQILQAMVEFGNVANTMPAIAEDKPALIDAIKTSISNLNSLPSEDYNGKLETAKTAKLLVDELVGISNSMAGFNQQGIENGLLGKLVSIINSELQSLVSNMANRVQDFYNIGTNFADNIANGFNNSNLAQKMIPSIDSVLTSFSRKNQSFTDIGNAYGKAIVDAFNNRNWYNDVEESGKNVSRGFAGGLSAEIGRINVAVGNLSSAAIDKLKSLLGIASPSKVFYELGVYTGEGLVEGILSTEDSLKEAMDNIVDDIQNPLDSIGSSSLDLAGIGVEGGGIGSNQTNNLTLNNNIYTQFDIDQMGRDILWNMGRY